MYPLCKKVLSTKSHPRAQAAAAILLEKCALYLPEETESIWTVLVKCLLYTAKETSFQESTTLAILHTLTSLCSCGSRFFKENAEGLKRLIVSSRASSRMILNKGNFSSNSSHYGMNFVSITNALEIYNHPEVMEALFSFIEAAVITERKEELLQGEKYNSSFTRSIIFDISSILSKKGKKIDSTLFQYKVLTHICSAAKSENVTLSVLSTFYDCLKGSEPEVHALDYVVEIGFHNGSTQEYQKILKKFFSLITDLKFVEVC